MGLGGRGGGGRRWRLPKQGSFESAVRRVVEESRRGKSQRKVTEIAEESHRGLKGKSQRS